MSAIVSGSTPTGRASLVRSKVSGKANTGRNSTTERGLRACGAALADFGQGRQPAQRGREGNTTGSLASGCAQDHADSRGNGRQDAARGAPGRARTAGVVALNPACLLACRFAGVGTFELAERKERLRIETTGAVQGVGFRPFVYRLATELALVGWVSNDSRGVVIEVEGPSACTGAFLRRLPKELPSRAFLNTLGHRSLPPAGYTAFVIAKSDDRGSKTAVVLPDIAVCDACMREVTTSTDRRYRYPFTNCTHCGPRFSIVRDLPYDRPNTTMRQFQMCPDCQREYESVTDRRFHAQPNACPRCGPHVWLARDARSDAERDDAFCLAAQLLEQGKILGVKGLGGFHLMVAAADEAAVRELRQRKHRWEKPLALMTPDLDAAKQLCRISDAEAALLASPEAPIVLVERWPDAAVAESVAPDNPYLGVMVAYTPLHRLLLRQFGAAVVATSGNLSDEPICIDNDEAMRRLGSIADALLLHDRPIERHVDDSVAAVVAAAPLLLRRARGYAPLPVWLSLPLPTILAVGAHQKNAVALSVGSQVFISQHIGDLDTPEAVAAHERVVDDLLRLYAAEARIVAHDLHPDYTSTRTANEWIARTAEARAARGDTLPIVPVAVQHHHAHLASCLADNGVEGPALGVIWDGTGYGTDGTIWGGEFLYGDAESVVRVAHLRRFRLPGGEAAAREPRRSALALLWELGLMEHRGARAVLDSFTENERQVLVRMMERGINCPITTSAGRLFDAVACLVGLFPKASYEGQAPMALEFAVERSASGGDARRYRLDIMGPERTDGAKALTEALSSAKRAHRAIELWAEPWVLDWRPVVVGVLDEVAQAAAVSAIAARFHDALVDAVVEIARRTAAPRVALSGGCFQNRVLLERTHAALRAAGHEVLVHRQVPANDGGICLGQVVVAARAIAFRGGVE
ncbi:MAG: carbamoyltransferase HypF [Polyangiaceae bacterium]|nr:carbamoyltransferase HypF [Polyangiaceae bacterium]